MPGFITHYICGEAVFKRLEPQNQALIARYRNLYNIGAQGPDMFFYYLPGIFNKNIRYLGIKMHKGNFRVLMSRLLDCLWEADESERNAIVSYICGYITHYALDCNAHPYIYYKSGFRKEGENIRGIRYSINHRNIESAIDAVMLKALGSVEPSDKRLWQLIHTTRKEAFGVADALSVSISEAYDVNIGYKNVYNAIAYMMRLTKILERSKGKARRFMSLSDNLTITEDMAARLLQEQAVKDGLDFLNLNKRKWAMPWDKTISQESSFPEMYHKAINEAEEMVVAALRYHFEQGEGVMDKGRLLALLGNNSLASGIDCEVAHPFQYAEIIYNT